MLGRLGITLSLVFSCVKSQFGFLYRNPVEMEEPWSCSPGRAPFSAGWGHPMQGKKGGQGTGVSSLLPHPSTSPALSCMVFLNSCPVSTQNQGYVQCLYILLSLPTPTPSGVMCGSLSFLGFFFRYLLRCFWEGLSSHYVPKLLLYFLFQKPKWNWDSHLSWSLLLSHHPWPAHQRCALNQPWQCLSDPILSVITA